MVLHKPKRRIWIRKEILQTLISARSKNTESMASVTLEVVKMTTLGYLLSLSICVSKAFTARKASNGSLPCTQDYNEYMINSKKGTVLVVTSVSISSIRTNNMRSGD